MEIDMTRKFMKLGTKNLPLRGGGMERIGKDHGRLNKPSLALKGGIMTRVVMGWVDWLQLGPHAWIVGRRLVDKSQIMGGDC